MTNIFMLSDGLADEDRFTAQLHYLIECVPSVGQGMVNALLTATGRPSTKFIHSEDHPGADPENRPDFLLVCEDFDILCEHKLQSQLGIRQLERYLDINWPRQSYLAFVSNVPCIISEEVRSNARYLSPRDAAHYFWRDLYGMLNSSDCRLANDFAAYMRSRGMKPLELPNGWSNLFEDRETAETFGEQFRKVRSYFVDGGYKCTIDADRRGFQVRLPMPWLHLLYFFVDPSADSYASEIEGPVLGARLYSPADVPEGAAFCINDSSLSFGSHPVRGFARVQCASWNPALRMVYEYLTPLTPVLSKDSIVIQDKLLEFAKGVFEHCQALVENSPSSIRGQT